MKKFFITLLSVTALASTSIGTVLADSEKNDDISVSTFAAKRRALKSFVYDKNTITKEETNFRNHYYTMIPASSRQNGYQNQQLNGAWNYISYLHTNFYTGGY